MEKQKNQVWFEKTKITSLNSNLIKSQNIDDERLEQLKKMHIAKYLFFEFVKRIPNEQTKLIKECAKVWEQMEFDLQKLWGFEEDNKFHRFWDFPKCSCPVMDNEDRIGVSERVYLSSCLVHGNK